MRLLALAALALAINPAAALEPRAYACVITDFADDSRYPLDEDALARQRTLAIVLVDAGDRIVVETTYPGEDPARVELPVTERTAERVVATVAEGEYYEDTVTLAATEAATAAGTLVHRTYETDHRWWFDCTAVPPQ